MRTKSILTAMILLGGMAVQAQEEMSTVWEANVGHKMDYMYTGLEGEVSICADDKVVTAVNNADGSIKWTKPYKEIAPKLRKINEMIPFWESDCLFIFDRKLGKDQIAVVNLQTGEYLWGTDQYQNVSEATVYYVPEHDGFAIVMTKGLVKKSSLVFIKAKTGEEVWETERFTGVIASSVKGDDGKHVLFNYAPSGLQFIMSGFKNQVVKLDFATGDIIWEAPYTGRFERKLLSKELVGSISIEEGKVFLTGMGIQAYDYKTGSQLWAASFDYTPSKTIGKPGGNIKAWGVYGAVAHPLIVGRDVYVLDMGNRKNQYVKKYDINSGRLLWTSPEIKAAKAIPGMYVIDDVVVLQVGGTVEVQYIEQVKNSDGSITTNYVITTKNVKPTGVQAFNSADGKLMWDSERFKKGITNMMEADGHVIVCSGKALYKMDVKTGAEQYEVDVKADGIGLTEKILPWKDQIIIVSDKGVSSHNVSDGKLKAVSKYKKSFMEQVLDDKLIMKTKKSDIACYNLDDISYKEFNARKGAVTHLMNKGKNVYVYEKKTLTKLSTN